MTALGVPPLETQPATVSIDLYGRHPKTKYVKAPDWCRELLTSGWTFKHRGSQYWYYEPPAPLKRGTRKVQFVIDVPTRDYVAHMANLLWSRGQEVDVAVEGWSFSFSPERTEQYSVMTMGYGEPVWSVRESTMDACLYVRSEHMFTRQADGTKVVGDRLGRYSWWAAVYWDQPDGPRICWDRDAIPPKASA